MSPDQLAAVGAFFSGLGSAFSAYLGIRYERRRGRQECEDRMKALIEGMRLEHQAEKEARWESQ